MPEYPTGHVLSSLLHVRKGRLANDSDKIAAAIVPPDLPGCSYHHLSARHLPAYLDEMAFRYNNRKNPYLFRDTLMKLIGSENLPYQELVGA